MSPFEQLCQRHSFSLQRVSPATFPQDVIATYHRRGEKISRGETEAICKLVRTGTAFRCRIAKGRYFYGADANEAIRAALAAARGKKC